MMEEKTLKELCLLMNNLRFTGQHNDLDYQCALTSAMDDMEHEEVQEKWRKNNIDPETNVTHLSAHVHLQGKIIFLMNCMSSRRLDAVDLVTCTQLCGMALRWPLKGFIASTCPKVTSLLRLDDSELLKPSLPF